MRLPALVLRLSALSLIAAQFAAPAGAAASQGARILRPSAVPDRAMGIERSHTMLLPEGWTVRGGVVWTPSETAINHLELELAAPDGMGVTFYRNGSAEAMESNMPQVQGQRTRLQSGASVSDVAVEEILKRRRPGARRIRVVEETSVKPMLKVYEGFFGATARQIERSGTNSIGGEQMSTRIQLDVPQVRVTYREGGETWEEEILFYLMKFETQNQSSFGAWYRSTVWHFSSPVSIRAKKGELGAARPLLYSVMGSVQPTKEWSELSHVMNLVVTRARHSATMASLEALRQSAQRIARSDAQVREQAADSWRQQQTTGDASQRAIVDSFAGVEQYRLPDGSTMALDAGYKRAFTDGDGAFLLTDDLLTDPNVGSSVEWKRIRTTGGR